MSDAMGATENHMMEGLQRDLPSRLKLSEIRRALGPAPDLRCLDVGADLPYLVRGLRRRGGAWSSVVLNTNRPEQSGFMPDESVTSYDGTTLPFDDKTFDAVAVVDALERVANDGDFIQECHRVLKPDGRIVILCHRPKPFSLATLIRRLFRATPEALGRYRSGYTEKELFSLLKTGFNVTGLRTHTRFFMEMVDIIIQARLAKVGTPERVTRLRVGAAPFYRLAYQLDTLLLLTRGYGWVVVGHRRAWRPRQAPVLSDTRTITEAVLSRPTA